MALAGLLGSAGCQTPEPVSPAVLPESYHVAVRQSDPVNRFVVLECLPSVPEGTAIDLYRGAQPVARVIMTGHRRGGYGVAVWQAGEPAVGDWGRPVEIQAEGKVP